MRHWIDIFTQQTPIQSAPLKSSLLLEFAGDNSRQLSHVVQILQQHLGGVMHRVGGAKRLYDVGATGQRGAIYVIGNSLKGIGLAWKDASAGVCSIYQWDVLNPFHDPDFEIDLPATGNFDAMAKHIVSLLSSQRIGAVPIAVTPVAETLRVRVTEARHALDVQFIDMANQMYGQKAASLTWPEITAVAAKNDVVIPGSIRHNRNLKVGPNTWNLSGGANDDDKPELAKALGSSIEDPEPVPGFQPMLQLAKAKEIKRLVGTGQIYIMGRKPSGAFFSVPGVAAYSAQMERMLANELADNGSGDPTMEEQYQMLADKVALIASGKSKFIKSLLITGAPSSGKSYNVMQTIKKTLGQQEGSDYIISTGMLTRPELYRLLIEQLDGMIILDDSDGIIEDKDAVNMLKGALDTNPVRQINYRVNGTINIAVLPAEQRDEYTSRLSRVLRQVPQSGDAEYFARYARLKNLPAKTPLIPTVKKDDGLADLGGDFQQADQPASSSEHPDSDAIFAYVTQHLPNRIDYRGRMIFISNLEQKDWPTAITSRADVINFSFSDIEMLNYIDKIKDNIDANLNSDQKAEVMAYLRQLWTMGTLKVSINFRLVQLCFDYRLLPSWRRLMAAL